MLAGGEYPHVYVYDVATKSRLRILKGHSRGVRSTLFSPFRGQAVTSSDDKTVRVWDVVSGEQLMVVNEFTVSRLFVSPALLFAISPSVCCRTMFAPVLLAH